MDEIARRGSVRDVDAVPDDVKRLFACALDIDPVWHVRMQAAFQKHTDNAVSKTVNLPADATPEDVKDIYRSAYQLGCKGITVYRYGCREEQTLSLPDTGHATDSACSECLELGSEETGYCRQCAT